MLNSEYLIMDQNYGAAFYQKLKKTSQTLSFFKPKSKKNFFLVTISCIISRSKRLARSNPNIMYTFILSSKVLGEKV